MQTITYKGNEYSFEFTPTTHGLRVWVMKWDPERNDWVTLDNSLHPLSTKFEALCYISAEHFGETVNAETLAQLLGIEMRFQEDADCLVCGTWAHYEEMISGSAIDHALADKLGLTQWDYACVDCVAKYETVTA